ncbi:MAG: hypothetical protein L6Q47_04925 [Ignavibacteriaceae bacterium]|nr:hypothetical protein [Ignavibacteriaceae bacterium]
MNIIMIAIKDIKEMAAKEFFISFFDFIGAGIVLGTSGGVHCRITLSLWKWETSFALHGWDGNIVRIKSQMPTEQE